MLGDRDRPDGLPTVEDDLCIDDDEDSEGEECDDDMDIDEDCEEEFLPGKGSVDKGER